MKKDQQKKSSMRAGGALQHNSAPADRYVQVVFLSEPDANFGPRI